MVSERRVKQPLVRGLMGKNRCRQPVDSVDSCESGDNSLKVLIFPIKISIIILYYNLIISFYI
jgi:hypothetical protein